MELMNELLEFMHGHLYKHIILIAVCITVTIIAMTIDLITGIQKAKQRGEATTSTGLKKTATKARKYFTPFFTLCCIDILCSVVIPLPAFSMLWTAYCIFCEFISVREKSWRKEEIRKAEKTMNIIIENKDDIAKLVAELLTAQPDKKEE